MTSVDSAEVASAGHQRPAGGPPRPARARSGIPGRSRRSGWRPGTRWTCSAPAMTQRTTGRARTCSTCSPTRPATCTWVTPRPIAIARRDRALLLPARLRRPAPDRLGLLRPARGERGDQARHAPGRLDLREHRDAGRSFRRYALSLRLDPAAAHLRPGVLPLDAVAVPALYERGLAYRRRLRQLVPARPDRAGQRAGHQRPLRALRRRGHQARADPVVLQDHRVRRPAAGRHGAAGGHLARARAADAAQLDRPVRGRARSSSRSRAGTSRSRSSRPGRTRCTARRSSWSPPTPAGRELCAPEQREELTPTWTRSQADRHRAPVSRPAEDRRLPGQSTRSTR